MTGPDFVSRQADHGRRILTGAWVRWLSGILATVLSLGIIWVGESISTTAVQTARNAEHLRNLDQRLADTLAAVVEVRGIVLSMSADRYTGAMAETDNLRVANRIDAINRRLDAMEAASGPP